MQRCCCCCRCFRRRHSSLISQDAVYDMDNRRFGGRTLKVDPSKHNRTSVSITPPTKRLSNSCEFGLICEQVELSKRPPASNWNELSRRREERCRCCRCCHRTLHLTTTRGSRDDDRRRSPSPRRRGGRSPSPARRRRSPSPRCRRRRRRRCCAVALANSNPHSGVVVLVLPLLVAAPAPHPLAIAAALLRRRQKTAKKGDHRHHLHLPLFTTHFPFLSRPVLLPKIVPAAAAAPPVNNQRRPVAGSARPRAPVYNLAAPPAGSNCNCCSLLLQATK
jgi:hypothetical protein